MPSKQTESNALSRLGEKLVEDIRRRGLCDGDRYLTTEQVSKMLGIRKSTANRVMAQLAKQQYLVRRQRSGTSVGPRIESSHGAAGGRVDPHKVVVQILLPSERGWSWASLPSDEMIAGVHDAIPGASVQFAFLPERDPVGYLDQLLRGALAPGWSLGVIAVSCSRDVYQSIERRGTPAVILGTAFPGMARIPSLDADYTAVGELATRYLLAKGRRRIGLLTWQTWHPGDNVMLESINKTLAAAGMPADSLVVRAVANDEQSYELEVRELLGASNPPSALLCRNQQLAGVAARAAHSLGLKIPHDVMIMHEGMIATGANSEFPCVVRELTARMTAERLAQLLLAQLNHEEEGETAPRHAALPVRVWEPNTLIES